MFSCDSVIGAALEKAPQTIEDVLGIMEAIEAGVGDLDGLKWFNWLYLTVTRAVKTRVDSGGFADPAWLSRLDVEFARLYFDALRASLSGAPCPGSWKAMFSVRDNVKITRIQFALAGMNAHINHDLCQAIVTTCRITSIVPQHGTPQYNDYTALNSTLDALIDLARKTLNVRLPGDPLPAVSSIEDVIAGWDI
ncbi:MAG TPA: DUF5995 family protein, partial [Bryobacteraceae bacterium]|nr:DUF5995 family protein [Bryobacteraceae bacterium]